MKVYLYELSEEGKSLHFSQSDPWVVESVAQVQESGIEPPLSYRVDLDLRKSYGVVFLKGNMGLELGLLCSRCANPFKFTLDARFECLYTRERSLGMPETNVGIAHSEPSHDLGEDNEIEVLEKDYIELADMLKEQIYLKLPVQPLCSEGCKGICPVCGQDRNVEPCQCHRLKNTALANALKSSGFQSK